MPTFRANTAVDPQQISSAIGSIADAFKPATPQEMYAGAKAQQTQQQIKNTSEMFNYINDPKFDRSRFDSLAIANGLYNPSQSYYGVDQADRRSGLNNAADNKRALDQTRLQQEGETTRSLLTPVGANATRFIPKSVASAYSLPEQQVGVVQANEGQTVTLPDGRTIMGTPKPLSMDQVRAAALLKQSPEVQRAEALRDIPTENVAGPNGPTIMFRPDAVGQRPAPPAAAPTNLGRLIAERGSLPPGDPRIAEYNAAIEAEGRGATADGYRSASDGALAKRHSDLVKAGDSATGMIGSLDALEPLLDGVPTGALAERRVQVAKYAAAAGFTDLADGLTNGKLDQAQAANAIVQRMAPLLRVPGSGAQSDRELQNFLDSVPSLRNTPGGNRIIIGTMRAAAQRQQQAADIARQAQAGTVDKFEAERQIAALPSPFAVLKARTESAPSAGGDAATPSGPTQQASGASASGLTPGHIAALRAHPDKAAEFDAKFGAGLAATILGAR